MLFVGKHNPEGFWSIFCTNLRPVHRVIGSPDGLLTPAKQAVSTKPLALGRQTSGQRHLNRSLSTVSRRYWGLQVGVLKNPEGPQFRLSIHPSSLTVRGRLGIECCTLEDLILDLEAYPFRCRIL